MTTRVALVYPFDPAGHKVGGVESFVRGFVQHAPPDLDVRHVGITTDPVARPVGRPVTMNMGPSRFEFLAALEQHDENRKGLVPLSLRFTLSLNQARKWCRGRVLLFNRLEPALAFRGSEPKIGFVHNDVARLASRDSEYAWRHAPWLYRRVERRLVGDLDQIYTVSTNTLSLFASRYPWLASRVAFLPSWVDATTFSPTPAPRASTRRELAMRLGFEGAVTVEGDWLVFVGRLQREKDPLLLIQTFARVLAKRATARLLIVGEGNLRDDTQRLAHGLGCAARVHFVGFRPQAELATIYQQSDLLLLTSHSEGMPRAVLEMLGSGRPVVSTDVGEVQRVVVPGRSGEIVNGREPDAIAQAVCTVLENPMRYSPRECVAAVAKYRPECVLSTVYERCRELAGNALRSAA